MPAERILIVEDERAFAQVVEGYLKRLGYQVAGIVDNGADALREAERSRPELTLMDIEIHGNMDGFEVAEEFRRKFDIPVIFLTGRADDVTLDQVRRSQSFGYLLKPFRPEELRAGIELALIRHRQEAELRRLELSLSAAIKSTGDAILMTNQAGMLVFLNPAAERLTGWPSRKAVGQPLAAVFKLRGDAAELDQLLRGAAQGAFVHEAILYTAAGRELPIEVNVSAVLDELHGPSGSVLVFRDITERKRFEAELKTSRAELRSLAGHLESAREAERTRIAREIHDEFGQLLTGLKYDLAWLEKKLGARPAAPRATLHEKVRAMGELLADMVLSVRRIAAELRPGILDDLGLAAAVEWQAKEFAQRTGIRMEVQAALPEAEVPRPIATALFRVLQESLTNVARHAAATQVWVNLRRQQGHLVLEVQDDGCGFRAAELAKPGAFGVLGMRERILPLRGACDIRSEPGQGTTVWVSVPLNDAANSQAEHD